ncbi:MAG: flagellar motor switch protein FliN [Anaerolineales bacterium]
MNDEILETQNEGLENPPQNIERPINKTVATKTAPETQKNNNGASLDLLMDVMLLLTVELGRAELTVKQVLDLQKGSVVELDRIAGDAVDVYVNEHLIAKGEVVVVDDKFGVRITELISPVTEEEASL